MPFFSKLRPLIVAGFFLSLVLSGVLSLSNISNAATPGAVTPVSGLSLTQGVRKTVLENGLTVLT